MKQRKTIAALALLMVFSVVAAQPENKRMNRQEKLKNIINSTIDGKQVFGVSVVIASDSFSWSGTAGNLGSDSAYFIASVTKMYTNAAIQVLRQKGLLGIDDSISKYLPASVLNDLHIYKGTDYSGSITVRQLLSNTSGLPDYFLQKAADGKILFDELIAGNDRAWTFEEAIGWGKQMAPRFSPGQKGKAYYSDINYQLLGRIIETVSQMPLARAYDSLIFTPLNLKNTYLFTGAGGQNPASLYYKSKPLQIPLAMASTTSDGGIVSTATENMVFLKAFFEGKLFPKSYLEEMYEWNRIFFPLQYGTGMMRFKLPRIFSPFKPMPQLIGHSGMSGAFAFYCPEKKVFLTGTVNQLNKQQLPFQLMLKLINQLD